MKKVLQVQNLVKNFQVKQKKAGFWGGLRTFVKPTFKEVCAVDNLSFEVNSGEILAFIGPNGAGKSTTIKMLTGILYPTSGELEVLGFHPQKQRQKLAFHIGTVFGQKPQLWFHLPAQDTFNLLARIYELDEKKYRARLKFLVDAFEIEHLLNIPVRKLSLGQRMRCEVAAALLHQPKIIFLDEPTIGLDVIAKQQIRKVIRHLNQQEKVTIFLTSHDAGDIESLAKRTMVINHGQMVFDGPTEQLKKNYITTKVVEIISTDAQREFKFEGGKVLERDDFRLKVELDTSKNSIEKLMNYAVEHYSIQDINIFDPEMEEIIAMIYREKKLKK